MSQLRENVDQRPRPEYGDWWGWWSYTKDGYLNLYRDGCVTIIYYIKLSDYQSPEDIIKICFEMKNVHAIRSFRSDFESATGHPGYVFDELYSAIRNKKHSFILICNDDVYIHIHNPNDNDEGTIEKVEFTHDDQQDNQKYDLDNDQKLLQLIEQINNCKSVSKKFYKQKLIKAMSNYCSSIIEQFNIDPEHLDSFVQSKLD